MHNSYNLKIRKGVNCWILVEKDIYSVEDQNGIFNGMYDEHINEEAFSFETNKEEVEAFQKLLYSIEEKLGPDDNNNYAKYTIGIVIKPGRKYEGKDYDWEKSEYIVDKSKKI